MSLTRRQMLKASLSSMAYYSAMSTTPNWIAHSAETLFGAGANANGRILVILQHGGGMDGLNTVIPRTDDIYYVAQTRPNIQIPRGSEINLDGLNGFHPQLARLADWYQQGNVGIINNVGYENPNQSHFTSTDIYEYAQNPLEFPLEKGWAARFYDNQCDGCESNPLDMLVAGKSSVPDSLAGANFYVPPAISNASDYSLRANEDSDLRLQAIAKLNQLATDNSQIDFLERSANAVQASIQDIATASALPQLVPDGSYSNDSFGRGLRLTSQIIRSGFQTRIFYVSQGGYDTHSNQVAAANPLEEGRHPRLMGRFDQSVDAFLTEMRDSGNLERVLVMTFSEFGRRVYENGSLGTDHGAANCMFLFGGGIQGGVYGGQPDLEDLSRGNLKYKVDFRSVYAQVIENWFGADAAPVFGQSAYDNAIRPGMSLVSFVAETAMAGVQSR